MEPLLPSSRYHIYNHANGFELIFKNPENYKFFMERYEKYILPIADTLAYCLMPNHFHLLICIKNEKDIVVAMDGKSLLNKYYSTESSIDREKIIGQYISKQFANLFSSYTQAFNKVYGRMGSLFMKNFKRKLVDSEEYLKDLIIYIHQNPVKHGFVFNPVDWKYSSYGKILSDKETFLLKNEVIELFGDVDNFKFLN